MAPQPTPPEVPGAEPTGSEHDAELEQLLRAEALYPVSLAAMGRILDAVLPPRRVSFGAALGRAAAAVLGVGLSWSLFVGAPPALADALPARPLVDALPHDLSRHLPRVGVREPDPDEPLWPWLLAGTACCAAGVALATRWHRPAPGDPQ
ncbi:MAG: hypothetical protein O2894_08145 [Planctomycetota bacterium]|nr:hypothetical protein [Planctomycetota bacterium]